MERTAMIINEAMEVSEWAYFTSDGVRKHAIQDAIDVIEQRGRDITPHGLAALCLYGKPYGFTDDDVTLLHQMVSHAGCNCGENQCFTEAQEQAALRTVAKLYALLP